MKKVLCSFTPESIPYQTPKITAMSVSKSRNPSEKLLNATRRSGNGREPPSSSDHAYVPGAVQKLEKLPHYSSCGQRDKRQLAEKLTSTEGMTTYFREYLHERNSFVLVHTPTPSSAESPASPSQEVNLEESIILDDENGEDLVARLSCFSLKLYLTVLPDRNAIQASLQVGDTLIEWTPDDLVIPHKNIPPESLIQIDLSLCLKTTLEMRERQTSIRQGRTEVDDRILRLCKARQSLIDHIVQVIVTYNRYYYYKSCKHNSQLFIQNIMKAVSINSLPTLSTALSDYMENLKEGRVELPTLGNHSELDSYVTENINDLDIGKIEYLAIKYYQLHLETRAKAADAGSITWMCPEEHCQMNSLCDKLIK